MLKIKAARFRAGKRPGEVAQKLCVSKSLVYKWERGLAYPDLPQSGSLARLYGCRVEDLVGHCDPGTIIPVPVELLSGRGEDRAPRRRAQA